MSGGTFQIPQVERSHVLPIAVVASVTLHGFLLMAGLASEPGGRRAAPPIAARSLALAVSVPIALPPKRVAAAAPPVVPPVAAPAPPVATQAVVPKRGAPARQPAPPAAIQQGAQPSGQIAFEAEAEAGEAQAASAEVPPGPATEPPVAAPAPAEPPPGSPQGAETGLGEGELARYGAGMRNRLMRHLGYPPKAQRQGIEGTVLVLVRVHRNGRLAGAPEVVESSGNAELDAAALRCVAAAAPFQALPGGAAALTEFTLPVRFALEDGQG